MFQTRGEVSGSLGATRRPHRVRAVHLRLYSAKDQTAHSSPAASDARGVACGLRNSTKAPASRGSRAVPHLQLNKLHLIGRPARLRTLSARVGFTRPI